MNKLVKYTRIILSTLHGLLLCGLYMLLPKKRVGVRTASPQVIVSLTSYGRRTAKTLKFAILSILNQTRRPDRIVVWLDQNEFCAATIPSSLKKLIDRCGVEVMFCENLRSYKKLIPSLKLFPDDIIITIDDDLVYDRHLIELLVERHSQYPESIITTMVHIPQFDSDGILPYVKWNLNRPFAEEKLLFPLGGSGTLYPPKSLHTDVSDSNLFLSLAPYADDIWFWCMGLMNGTRVRVVGHSKMYMEIDLIHQFLHKDSSLKGSNLGENRNDNQLKAVLNHYDLKPERLFLENLYEKS